MKRITKAVFGYGRPYGLNLLRRLAFAENGLCCATKYLVPEIQMERQ
jgi:hypothetical protein